VLDFVVSNKKWFCWVYRDPNNDLKGACQDTTKDISEALTTSAVIPFDGKASSTITGINCIRPTDATDESFICDTTGYDFQVFEVRMKLDPATAKINKASELAYRKYGDSIGFMLSSSNNYIACLVSSLQDRFVRVLVWKRQAVPGGGPNVHFSVDVSEFTNTQSIENIGFALYTRTADRSQKLLVQDYVGKTIAKIYNITDMKIDLGSIGYYEQDALRTTNLSINTGLTLQNTSLPVYNLFFNPALPNKDINDRVYTNYFFDYLGWWIALFVIIGVVLIVIAVYFIRRETADKYLNSSF